MVAPKKATFYSYLSAHTDVTKNVRRLTDILAEVPRRVVYLLVLVAFAAHGVPMRNVDAWHSSTADGRQRAAICAAGAAPVSALRVKESGPSGMERTVSCRPLSLQGQPTSACRAVDDFVRGPTDVADCLKVASRPPPLA